MTGMLPFRSFLSRLAGLTLGLVLALGALLPAALAQQPASQALQVVPRPPQLAATSYILIDAATGNVLVEHEADVPQPPASLTKIMTSYVAANEMHNGTISNDDQVFVSVKAWQTEGSKMFIQEGTSVRLEDILRGIIIQSGNDSSIALAEHIAGSEGAFADMMNQHARSLGMSNSYFLNASGLPAEQHVMSARDLATLARALIQNFPEHYEIYSEKEFTYNGIRQPNRNTLLFRDDTVDGVKTGHTEAAGYCLVASAVRDSMRLIAVVMGTTSENARAQETASLLNYGFRFFETYKLFDSNEEVATEQVWSGKSNQVRIGVQDELMVTLPRGRSGELQTTLEIADTLKAPIEAGQVLGNMRVALDDQVYYEGPVVALEAVERGGLLKRLMDFLHLFFLSLFS